MRTRHSLGPQLLALRKDAGLSRRAVAQALGSTHAAVGQWENGYSWPPMRYHSRLSTLYAVDTLPLPTSLTRQSEGTSLAAIRHRAGLRQADVARAIGATQAAVSGWESGERPLPLSTLAALAAVYGVLPESIELPPHRPKSFGPPLDGARLRAARKARGWSQEEFAERLDMSANAVARWETESRETERRTPRWETWDKVTAVLEATIEDLSLAPKT